MLHLNHNPPSPLTTHRAARISAAKTIKKQQLASSSADGRLMAKSSVMAVVGIEIVRKGEGGGCCCATVPAC